MPGEGLEQAVAAFAVEPSADVPPTGVRIAVLGPLEVHRDGVRVEPTSPKVRALLLDFVVHRSETVGRDRLIDDLWGEHPPATAAGVLQNYVSQLRRALGADAVRTAGQGYGLALDDITVDIAELEAHLDRARQARDAGDTDTVRQAATEALALWRGEPLIDVAFEPFARAEIGRLHELRANALELALEADLAAGRHRDAVAQLEAAVTAHPLHERLWWLLMLALYRSGRQADALRAFQRARATLANELGVEPGTALRELEQAILEQRPDLDTADVSAAPRRRGRRARPRPSLLGRDEEWSRIEGFLDADDESEGLLLLVGEAGIGKTRLLEEVQSRSESSRGAFVAGRAFEAERGRPYGAWVDALRGVTLPALDDALRAGLAPLLPELASEPVELEDTNRLYDAVIGVLDLLARNAPAVVAFDDAQWLDEPSVALLHHAIRHLGDADIAFVATARPAELDDNAAAVHLLQALRRDGLLTELRVGPLPVATITEITASIAPDADGERIAEATNGNPLFAIEMAKALARGDEPLSSRVDALIGDRLARLDATAASLVPWIAAFGREMDPTLLAQAAERDVTDLFEPLGELERHGVVEADDDGHVDFVHDLVRTAAYKRLSTPRRAMLHARLGKILATAADADPGTAADAARHADRGNDSSTCAAACVRAARHCLRLLAYADAEELVTLGRTHAHRLPPVQRVTTELDLIHVLLHPGIRLRDPGELARDLSDLCAEAQQLGLHAELSGGLSLLARAYHWGWGDIPRARALLHRAAQLIEGASEPNLEPLLEGARCLAYLEMDMERTARLFDDLGTLHALAATSFQYQWGLGLVHAWRGDVDDARAALTAAIELATARGDHWVAFECTARLALLELEAGNGVASAPLCEHVESLAAKLGEGSERPYASALAALHAVVRGDDGGIVALDTAIVALEAIDARFLVPDLLGVAAESRWRAGDADAAALAERAIVVAEDVSRPFETARAHALLACIAAEHGDDDSAQAHLAAVASSDSLPGHVEGLRREAVRRLGTRRAEQGVETWP